jgi:hypothetical protein
MKTMRRWQWACTASFGLAAALSAGCQTWTYSSGMTLPSGRYLQHPPQYIPPSPVFPLQRELATQETIAAESGLPVGPGAPGVVPPPAPVVPPPVPLPVPPPAELPPPGM